MDNSKFTSRIYGWATTGVAGGIGGVRVLVSRRQRLATIAATAPFVGLFGTVIGIFGGVQEYWNRQTTVLKVIAGSISEALLTTAMGLSVAVPAVWCCNHFSNEMQAFGVEISNSSSELVSYLQTRLVEGKGG